MLQQLEILLKHFNKHVFKLSVISFLGDFLQGVLSVPHLRLDEDLLSTAAGGRGGVEGCEAVVQQYFVQLVVDSSDMLPDRRGGVGLTAEDTQPLIIQRLVSLLDIRQEMFQHQVELQQGEILLLLTTNLAPLCLRLLAWNSSLNYLSDNTPPGLEAGESRKSFLFKKLIKVAVTQTNVTDGHLFFLESFIAN